MEPGMSTLDIPIPHDQDTLRGCQVPLCQVPISHVVNPHFFKPARYVG